MKRQGAFADGGSASARSSYARARERNAAAKSSRNGSATLGWTMLCCSMLLVAGLYLVNLHVKNNIINSIASEAAALSAAAGAGATAGVSASVSARAATVSTALSNQDSNLQSASSQPEAKSPTSVRQQRINQAAQKSEGVVSLEEIENRLRNSPYHRFIQTPPPAGGKHALEDVLVYLHDLPQCRDKPVFTTMANVGSELYWQLIENFVYTMAKYSLTDCTLMICVSDQHCMDLCASSHFPCFDYQHQSLDSPEAKAGKGGKGGKDKGAHPMEQIAQLKLYVMPKALQRGVDLFMLDLDVGFLDDPMKLVSQFYQSREHVDAFVQEDVVFIMNRSVAGWKQWWTEPMPNIGLFLVRGNKKSSSVFESAWNDYSANTPKNIRMNPGKDQNKVVQAMRNGRWRTGFKWGYIPNNTAVLIDKVFKFEDMSVELGGEASGELLSGRGAVAVHTTCYEQKTKIMGLKAANAFWNPRYYNPQRRTLTKKILFTTPRTVLQEVRTLLYLALRSNRTLIIPNLLAATVTDPSLLRAEDKRSNKVQRPVFRNQTFWPGFRVLFLKGKGGQKHGEPLLRVEIAEPAFYWRVKRDYSSAALPVPEPHILSFPETISVKAIEKALRSAEHDAFPRVVLHVHTSSIGTVPSTLPQDLATLLARQVSWAEDSVGQFLDFGQEVLFDRKLPELDVAEFEPESEEQQRGLAGDVVKHTRLCANILDRMRGNRSCFDKCS